MELIRENPDSTVSQILVQTDVSRSTLLYHLSVLERHGYIRSKVWAGYRHFYPTGVRLGEQPRYSTPAADRVWELVKMNPGLTQRELAQLTGTSKQAIQNQLSRLQLDNRVNWLKQGRYRRWFIED